MMSTDSTNSTNKVPAVIRWMYAAFLKYDAKVVTRNRSFDGIVLRDIYSVCACGMGGSADMEFDINHTTGAISYRMMSDREYHPIYEIGTVK